MQNIPAKNKEIRSVFRAGKAQEIEKEFDGFLHLYDYDEVETQRGWVKAKDLKTTDSLIVEDGVLKIASIRDLNGIIQVFPEEENKGVEHAA